MTDLEHKILESIERQNLTPKPAYVFFAKRGVFWLLAILSIILGSISFAVLLYGASGFLKNGLDAFDEVPFDEFLLGIPIVWLMTLPLFAASAYIGFRHTRRGYRVRPVITMAVSLLASLVIGAVLHLVGAGKHTDEYLERSVPFYERITHIPYDEWSRPDQGFLGGHADRMLDEQTLQLIDFNKQVWTVDITAAKVTLDNPLINEGDVAIRGQMTSPGKFRADTIMEFD
jgi:hypothetical protein